MTFRSALLGLAALTTVAAPAAATTYEIELDASQFISDGFFMELSTATRTPNVDGVPSGLDGLLVELMYEIDGQGGFMDIWTIDNTDANSFAVTGDDGMSLEFTGEFDDIDFLDNEPFDVVVMTISGFRPGPSVLAALNAAPRMFFGSASEVAPIPLPFAAPVLLGALGLLGALRLRRA